MTATEKHLIYYWTHPLFAWFEFPQINYHK